LTGMRPYPMASPGATHQEANLAQFSYAGQGCHGHMSESPERQLRSGIVRFRQP